MAAMVFHLAFYLAAPFWGLMILAPTWSWTRRIVSSPLIALPAVAGYAVLVVPRFGEILAAVARPELSGIAELLSTPEGAAIGWAHFIAFDLFVGRWMYLDARDRGVHPLPMAPILVFTILLGPLGFATYLAVRSLPVWRAGTRDATPAANASAAAS